MHTRRTITAAVAAASLLALVACSSSSNSSSSTGATGASSALAGKKVSFIPGVAGDNFYITMQCGVEAEAKKFGLSVNTQAPTQFDPSLQTPLVNAALANKPDAMLIAPTDSAALFVPLLQAKNAGVKVGLVDTTLNDTSVAVTSVSTDNAAGGAAAADALAKLIGEKGTVLVIAFKNGVSTSDQRTQGFIDAIKKHPNIKLLPTQSADKTPAKATTIVNGTLSEHPDLVGIFATNQDVASGAATAIRQVNKQGQIKIVGFDAGPVQVKALQDGSVQALIAQMPYQIGLQAVDQIAAALKGQTPKTHVGTQVFTLTKDNMGTPDGQNAVYKTSC
jgi:ribose transport system substrate-binding protein